MAAPAMLGADCDGVVVDVCADAARSCSVPDFGRFGGFAQVETRFARPRNPHDNRARPSYRIDCMQDRLRTRTASSDTN